MTEKHEIRALFDGSTIRVYQAYPKEIAKPALKAQTFVAPFSMSRWTWIKPSFNWMMYRSGYASKVNQEYILAIDITHEGFRWALDNACLTSFAPGYHDSQEAWKAKLERSPVRVQWDPERDWRISAVSGVRSLQVGLGGEAVQRYLSDWIVAITDITDLARRVEQSTTQEVRPAGHPEGDERVYFYQPDHASGINPTGAESS